MEYSEYLDFAIKMAKSAGEQLKQSYSLMLNSADFFNDNIQTKGQNKEIVTKVEKEAEALMRGLVKTQYPNHDIAGEELGYDLQNADFLWVFDPVDGTAAMIQSVINYKNGLIPTPESQPYFGLTIALLHRNQPKISVIYDFINENMWTVADNQEPLLNNKPIPQYPTSQLSQAVLCSTAPEIMFSSELQNSQFMTLKNMVHNCYTNRNCIGFMQLLSGDVNIVWEGDLAFHDVAALVPFIKNAYLKITFEDGEPIIFSKDNYYSEYRIIAAHEKLHKQVLEIIQQPNTKIGDAFESNNNLYSKKF
jgi:myo-inositol-1(or 4)-monophosphatase